MRRFLKDTVLIVGAATVIACSARDDQPLAWTCNNVGVPNGANVECTATSSSALDGTYTCNNGGDYNPDCPPPGTGSDAGTDDGGTSDFNPDGGGAGDDGGGGAGSDGGTNDGVPDSGTGGGSDGGTGDGVPDSGGGGPPGQNKDGGGGPPGPPGQGNDGGSSGPPGSGSDGGSGYPPGSGSDGGSGYPPGSGGDGGTTDGPPPWTCEKHGNNITCHAPPKCDPGNHPAQCGACVPDGTVEDCVPPDQGGCWVTGGGFIIDSDGKDTFGGNGMPMKSGVVRGQWEHQDHGTGDMMHGQVAYLYCRKVAGAGPGHPNGPQHTFDLNQVYYGGPGRWSVGGVWSDGYWFDIVAEDHGEPGRSDFYQITIRKYVGQNQSGPIVYQTSGDLAGGNIQLHPPNAGHPFSSPAMPPWVALQP
jgi:hypothetical protein